ncbi:hypothetical protein BS50DRAFT_58506 [Corynespora cassiicola Philippines]|uniref:Uncharacterized protein n=1 Tax=Corynespora cassiicola Philippines TaxID=1448308 RepID=A0A2T2NJA5_CORCC|nr:hypothetical protein BS50DRAFT_58506 [Corynespora cassiicola Philippines]
MTGLSMWGPTEWPQHCAVLNPARTTRSFKHLPTELTLTDLRLASVFPMCRMLVCTFWFLLVWTSIAHFSTETENVIGKASKFVTSSRDVQTASMTTIRLFRGASLLLIRPFQDMRHFPSPHAGRGCSAIKCTGLPRSSHDR